MPLKDNRSKKQRRKDDKDKHAVAIARKVQQQTIVDDDEIPATRMPGRKAISRVSKT